MPVRGGMMFMGPGGFAQVKADGTFTAKNLGQEDYIVNVNQPGDDSYVKSIHSGGEEFLYTGLNIARLKGPLEIVLSTRGGKMEGGVADADGKPVQGATVIAVPDKPVRSRSSSVRTATTDQNGHFNLRALRPGSYKLYALDDVDEDQYRDPDFLARLSDKAVSLKVDEGSQSRADLKLVNLDSTGTAGGN